MKTILVATDFHNNSESATRMAVALTKQFDAELTVLHAYHLFPYYTDMYPTLAEQQFDQLKAEAQTAMLEWCTSHLPADEVMYNPLHLPGLASDVIIEQTKKLQPELLVMGTRKTWLIDKVIFGSVAGTVMADVTCPVLVVPENTEATPLKKLLYATDFHDSDLDCIRQLVDLAKPSEASLTVLHIVNDQDPDQEFDTSYFDDFQKEVEEAVNYPHIRFELVHAENLVESLNTYTQVAEIDLLAMAKTGKNWFARLFSPSITRKHFYRSTVPTLFFTAVDDENSTDF